MVGNRDQVIRWLFEQEDGKQWEIKEKREKRSKDANALMWHCLSQMAKAISPPIDKWDMYLMELKKYGKFSYVLLDEKAVDSFKKLWRETEVVGEVDVNGRKAVQLLCYYGSSTYNTKEMSVLLDGVIDDMKQMELEPPTPRAMRESLDEWERICQKRTTRNQ